MVQPFGQQMLLHQANNQEERKIFFKELLGSKGKEINRAHNRPGSMVPDH